MANHNPVELRANLVGNNLRKRGDGALAMR